MKKKERNLIGNQKNNKREGSHEKVGRRRIYIYCI
jgi:hypothetical protein